MPPHYNDCCREERIRPKELLWPLPVIGTMILGSGKVIILLSTLAHVALDGGDYLCKNGGLSTGHVRFSQRQKDEGRMLWELEPQMG